jgi:signal peptidase I
MARAQTRFRAWRSLLFIAAVALVGSALIKMFVFQAFYVPSGSMKETLQVSDRFIATRFGSDVRRGDIVVFYDSAGWMADTQESVALRKSAFTRFLKISGIIPSQNNDVMVKRVIGVPGDHVECCNSYQQISVNGAALDEPYLPEGMYPSMIKFDVVVPENMLFLLGDNRTYSADSRRFLDHSSGGFVSKDDVIGRATFTIWPHSNWVYHSRRAETEASP